MRTYHAYYLNEILVWMVKSTLIFFVFVFNASAGIVWETINAPVDSNGSINNAIYAKLGAEGRIASIDFNDPTPNPCHTIGYCSVIFGAYHNYIKYGDRTHIGTYQSPSWSSKIISQRYIVEAKTMGELYRGLATQPNSLYIGKPVFGYTTWGWYCDPGLLGGVDACVIKNKWEAYSKVCYALVYTPASSAYYYPFPGQGCIGPNPPNNECNIDAGSVTLDHGQLGTDEVNGHRKRESFRISCTYPANAEVSVVSNNANEKIMLKGDGSLYSTVTVDGVPGIIGKKITIPTGGVPIDLESTLHTVGNIEEGPFSGNGILIINAY
ncbi:MrpH family fimbial adhesin [Serratia sp. IR-2025]